MKRSVLKQLIKEEIEKVNLANLNKNLRNLEVREVEDDEYEITHCPYYNFYLNQAHRIQLNLLIFYSHILKLIGPLL